MKTQVLLGDRTSELNKGDLCIESSIYDGDGMGRFIRLILRKEDLPKKEKARKDKLSQVSLQASQVLGDFIKETNY